MLANGKALLCEARKAANRHHAADCDMLATPLHAGDSRIGGEGGLVEWDHCCRSLANRPNATITEVKMPGVPIHEVSFGKNFASQQGYICPR
jgi:hypothetical protein